MQDISQHQQPRRLRTALSFTSGIAATLAAGITFSAVIVGAAQPAAEDTSSFVPITPCRLMDTRPGDNNVGPRATPLGAGETHVQQVTGTNGNCTIPAGATAVALNATAVGGTATSYITFFPSDHDRPLSSNLNFGPGQAPTPNKVDVQLSGTGSIGIFNAFGQVNVVVDVMGYYVAASQSFATTAHGDGQALFDDPASVVSLTVLPPSDGALVVSSSAQFGSLGGGRAQCSINDELAISVDHPQIFDAGTGVPGSLAGSRTFAVSAGQQIDVSLVCRRLSGTIGVNEADLSAIFLPSFVPQPTTA